MTSTPSKEPVKTESLAISSSSSSTVYPFRKVSFNNGNGDEVIYLPAFGGEFQPGLYKPKKTNIANPAPLGLCAFALTTFVLSLINAGARGVTVSNIVVSLAYAYGGLIQLLSGMWEMAVGNTFGATALSSYGGFWISYAIVETASGFGIVDAYGSDAAMLHNALGFYLIGWFVFTMILWILTWRSTLAFSTLFLTVWLVFLFLAISHFQQAEGKDGTGFTKAAGVIGCIAAFLAWWNAMAGIADKNNSFFTIPVVHFPWSAKPEDVKKGK